MAYDIVKEGFIHRCPPDGPEQVAATGRCAVTRNGQILCSYMTQSALSQNDFVPMLSGSSDNGNSWQTHRQIWPHLRKAYSINVSISRSSAGDLFLFGSRTPRTRPDESFWSQETLGILQNELVWSRSMDDGATWTDPCAVAVPLPGAAESPAPLCITRTGRWVAPYSPHNTFDPNLKVDLRHVVLMQSDDQGQTWRHNSMIRVTEDDAYVAEAWVTELSTGVLLGTAWHLRRGPGDDFPNAYALSTDNGRTWGPTRATPIRGQSAGMAPLDDGKVLFAYNQRRHGTPGVWLALAKPNDADFGVVANEVVWRATDATRNATSGKSTNWTDFAFGEPSVTVLPDQTALVAFWCIQPDGAGIRYVKVKLS
ncbi:MAG: exo-alpha-sialidase [Phycisphaerales bacterium]|nr:exo-alpha-sialidase [Phycisphaerales bacterium]